MIVATKFVKVASSSFICEPQNHSLRETYELLFTFERVSLLLRVRVRVRGCLCVSHFERVSWPLRVIVRGWVLVREERQ